MILLPFFVPDAATQSPSPFWIVISLPPSLHGPSLLRSSAGEPLLHYTRVNCEFLARKLKWKNATKTRKDQSAAAADESVSTTYRS